METTREPPAVGGGRPMPAAWAFPFARRSVTNTTIGGNSSMEERIALVGIIVEGRLAHEGRIDAGCDLEALFMDVCRKTAGKTADAGRASWERRAAAEGRASREKRGMR